MQYSHQYYFLFRMSISFTAFSPMKKKYKIFPFVFIYNIYNRQNKEKQIKKKLREFDGTIGNQEYIKSSSQEFQKENIK